MGVETIAIASLAMATIGTGMAVVGQVKQSEAASANANYQSQVARNAEQVANQNATFARQKGEIAAQNQQRQTALLLGKQRAALASQGSDINSGSATDIYGDTARTGALDTLTIRNNAAREEFNFKAQAAGAGGMAGMADATGANARGGLPFGVGATLLGGASSIGEKFANYSNKFGWLQGGGGSFPIGGGHEI